MSPFIRLTSKSEKKGETWTVPSLRQWLQSELQVDDLGPTPCLL